MHQYVVIYERPEGALNWGAYVPDLPGCIAVGDSLDEVKAEMATAIALHLEALQRHGYAIPLPSSVAGTVSVA
ncbi:type II toxin-antitoxin system HicB family antitoxin [Fimbriimonas ginsengisoli]|uniref:HicB-like antitoxin of toxin-antitoxin system domain-containing protein n=1 Tax=Fimbriimonas ginsengisoli Gsoil 348 TaxID=661478 RepID=A0A068NPZ2_FIMGI|nr:hypothetical protein OP10G_2074 [Fimbriimonas ginsengisoli Gsoil 348]